MLVPGVLPGSKGPLLYPPDEIRKSPEDWNHIPIVVYHPMKDGKPVSARSPSILSKHGVGIVFHARTDGKDILKSEGWLDVEATRRVDKSVLDSVQLGKPIELSTGLFVDDEPAPEGAIFNDHRGSRKYVGIARNYKPDHLAILPSGKGACSLADGCGVLINEAAMEAYQVIVNELETEAISLYFPDLDLDLLTANKFNPNQPRDKAGRFATVAEGTAAVSKAQERVAKAQAALKEAKATLKVEKDGLLVARKGLAEVKGIEKARSPAGQRAIEKAKASTSEAHATGKRLKELSDRLTGGVGRQGKGTADLQAEGRAEASKALAGIRTKAHAAAVAEGFGILPGKTVAETKATISRHIETRIGSVARSRLTERPVHTSEPAATSTPTASRPTAKAQAVPDFHTLAHTTHEANKRLTDTRSGLTPVIPRLHEEVAKTHPGLTEKAFHEHLKELEKRDIATLQVWETSVPISKSGYPRSRFPSGGRHDAQPIGWVQFHSDATSRINAEPGGAKASAGTASPRAAPKPAASPRAGKSGKSAKSIDEHHAETDALIHRGMAGEEHIGRRGFKEFRPAESHEDFSKAVDSHIAGLNKSLNKAQVIELGLKLGMSHHESATKKSVLDRIRTDIHARRGASDRPAATGGTAGHTTPTAPKTAAATSPHGFQSRTPEEHHAVYQDLMRQGMAGKETRGAKGLTSWDPKLSDKEFASRVNSFGEHLNKVANKDHVNKVLGQLGLAPRSKKDGIAFLKTLLKENRYGFLRAYE
jgi:hypothetical protein